MIFDKLNLSKKIEDKLKSFINSIRIPPLLSFIIKKSGKITNGIEDALKDAPKAIENWERMKLGKKVFGEIKVWMVLALPLLMLAVKHGAEALQFFIEIGAQAAMLVPFAIILYYLYKSVKK